MKLMVKLASVLLPIGVGLMAYGGASISANDECVDVVAAYRFKHSLTAAQKKIDTHFLQLVCRNGISRGIKNFSVNGGTISRGNVTFVECKVKCQVSDRLINLIQALGGEVISKSVRFEAVHIKIPVANLDELAADKDVQRIERLSPRSTNKKTTSEGTTAHRVKAAWNDFGVTGKGVKVGVISDSARYWTQMRDSGDLPSDITIMPGADSTGQTGEGSGMMEIVYDMAPGAKLYFADSGASEEEMAENILALRQAGCSVIVDDITYWAEPAFQDGPIAQAVNTVVDDGCIYLSSAGNNRNNVLEKGNTFTSIWEGDFVPATAKQIQESGFLSGYGIAPESDGSVNIDGVSYYVHCYNGTTIYNHMQFAYSTSDDVCVTFLGWADSWGGSSNDYDYMWYDVNTGEVVDFQGKVQDGKGVPQEWNGCDADTYAQLCKKYTGISFVILKKKGSANRFLRIDTLGCGYLAQSSTQGTTYGHNAAEKAICVAAAPVVVSRAFASSDPLEDFSSEGPRRMFFKADGTAITSDNFSSTGGRLLQKPDVTGADKSASSWPYVNGRFGGTSAAAPHIAGIVALMLERNNKLTPSQVKEILYASTVNGSQWDYRAGYGIVDAYKAVENATEPAPVAPQNDNIASATVINTSNLMGSRTGTNVSATKDAGFDGEASVWWKWTAPKTADTTFDTLDSDFDTWLYVYKGANTTALVKIADNNDANISTDKSRVKFRATAGTVYYIAVAGNCGKTGNITLKWEQTPEQKPDLEFALNSDNASWPKALFLSGTRGQAVQTKDFKAKQNIYSYWSFKNSGNVVLKSGFVLLHEILKSSVAVQTWTENMSAADASSVGNHSDSHFNNLEPGNYIYRIRLDSQNAIEELDETNNEATYSFTVAAPTPPAMPTNLQVSENNLSSYGYGAWVKLTWNGVTDDNGYAVEGYYVYRNTNATRPSTPWRVVSRPTVSDSTCSANTTYYYWVVAFDGATTSSATPYVSIKPSVNGSGTSFTASASVIENAIALQWSAVSSWAKSISIYRSTDGTMPSSAYASVSKSENTWLDPSAEPGVQYYYWVMVSDALLGDVCSDRLSASLPSQKPDLTFYHWNIWPHAVFLGTSSESPASATSFLAGQTVYLYCCWANYGASAVGTKWTMRHQVLIRGTETVVASGETVGDTLTAAGTQGWASYGIDAHEFLQNLPRGLYTYRCTLDTSNVIAESDEVNNEATFDFEVVSPGCDLAFCSWTGWTECMFLSFKNLQTTGLYEPICRFAQGEAPFINLGFMNSLKSESYFDKFGFEIFDAEGNRIRDSMGTSPVTFTEDIWWGQRGWGWEYVMSNLDPGTYRLRLTLDPESAVNDVNRGNNTSDFLFAVTNCTLVGYSEALEADNLVFTGVGTTPPFVQTQCSYDGAESVQFGPCAPGETNGLSTKVIGPGKLSFKWFSRCASVQTAVNHHLVFRIDGGDPWVISGDMNGEWRSREYEIPSGQHTLSWLYCKDLYADKYLDSAWLDQVLWTPYIQPEKPALSSLTATDMGVNLVIRTSDNAKAYQVYRATANNMPTAVYAQFSANGMNYQTYMDGGVNAGETYHYWIVALGAGDTKSVATYCGAVMIPQQMESVPDEYGPFGRRDDIDDSGESGAPTTLRRMVINVYGHSAALNDCLALYRKDTGKLCGLGRVDWNGRATIVMTIRQGIGLHFKLWTADSGLDTPEILDCDAASDLMSPAQGTTLEDVVVNFSDSQQLQFSFAKAGWHKMSLNVLPADAAPANVCGDVAGNLELLSGSKGRYWDFDYDEGTLSRMEIGDGYWLKTKVDNVNWTVSGSSNPKAKIQLQQGWNLVGYPLLAEGNVDTVLATAIASGAIDMIVGDKGAFWPDGDLRKMSPGQGYYIYALAAYELGYDANSANGFQSQTTGNGVSQLRLPTNGEDEDAYGPFGTRDQIDDADQSGSPTTLRQVQITVNGTPAAEGDCIAVYRADHNSICGLGRVNANGRATIVMTIKQGVELHFKLWIASSGTASPCIIDCDAQNDIASPAQGDVVNGLTLAFMRTTPVSTCTVTFVSNGGTGVMASQTVQKSVATKLNKCTFTKTGYSFRQWSGSDGQTYQDQQSVTLSADLALTAQWTGNVYRVTLDSQGGNGGTASVAATYGSALPSISVPTRSSYKFGGYYAGKNGTDTQYYDANGASVHTWDKTSGATLYAYWIEGPMVSVLPTSREHGWRSLSGASFEVACNTAWTVAKDTDWITLAVSSGTGNGTVTYSLGENTGAEPRKGTITVATADGTKYAEFEVWQRKWTAGYTVTFLPGDGGSGYMSPQDFDDGVAQKLSLNRFKRTGYVFLGWKDQNDQYYIDGEEIEPTSDLTLTAIWIDLLVVYCHARPEQSKAKGTVQKSPKDAAVKVGTTVSLTAKTANKNTVFAYWTDVFGDVVADSDGMRIGYAATMKVKPDELENNYYAVFRLKSACKRPVFEAGNPYGDGYMSANSMVGVAYKAQIVVNEDAYPVKFSATGLPKGLKINATTGVISGVPTKAGTFKPTITVKSAANSKLKASSVKLPITIAKLPVWARGTFNGRTFVPAAELASGNTNGSVKVTVGATGKISGKIALGGTNWTVSASSYSVDSDAEGETFVAKGTATTVISKKTYKLPWSWTVANPGGEYNNTSGEGTLGSVDEYGDYPACWSTVRDIWKDSGAKAELVGDGYWQYGDWTGAYVWYTPDGERLTLTVAANGTVKAAGTLLNGRKLSLSTTLLYDFFWPSSADGDPFVGLWPVGSRRAVIYAPPQTVTTKDKKGKVVSKVSYKAFFEEVAFVNEPGTPEVGDFVAYRKPGVRAVIDEDSTGTGTIKYSTSYGQAASNATVTVTATAAKKNVFAYWMLNGEIVSYSASYKAKMGDADFTGLAAVFRKASDFKAKPEMPYVEDGDFGTMRVGIPFRAVVDVNPECRPVKFTAKNLPAGLKLNATTGVISGVPTAVGAKTISITATSVANTKLVSAARKIPVSVAALHSWAKGTFTGKGDLNGKTATATLTVGTTGKISGKFTVAKKSYAFSASSYSVYDGYYEAKAKLTYGKTTYPVVILVDLDGETGKGFALLDVMFNDDREGQFGAAEVIHK